MRITALPAAFHRAANTRPPELSPTAAERLLEMWRAIRAEGATAQRAADILHTLHANLYRWQARLDKRGLPGYGKGKIAVELRKRGRAVSSRWPGASSPTRSGADSANRRARASDAATRPKRPYAIRKPKDYRPTRPGDLVQVDTLDVRPLPGVVLKRFTARDVVYRCDVLQVGTRANAASAARFLDAIVERMPFPVKAIQVDGGLRVPGRVRRGVQGARRLAVRPAAAFAEVERLRGARGDGRAWRSSTTSTTGS